jgi:putative ABC transport system permease protein
MAAVGFAVVVMFMQLGFFGGFNESQARLALKFDGDLVIMNSTRTHFNNYAAMLRAHMGQIEATPGVTEAIAIHNYTFGVKNPKTGQYRRTYLLAWRPGTHPFQFPDLDERELERTGTVLFDRFSRDIYGPLETGTMLDIEGRKHRLAGFFEFGPNFSNDGNMVTSEATLLLQMNGARDKVDWVLARVKPGESVETVQARLRSLLPTDLTILTPREMHQREIDYTTRKAPVGIVFGLALVVGFVIGTSICYQLLFNEINEHLHQFATLKAMGFSSGFLSGIVLVQAALLGVVGYFPGLAGGWIIYRIIERKTGIVMAMSTASASLVLMLAVAMCVLAGLIAVRRVLQSDPAELV